jgi:hypothetical protein
MSFNEELWKNPDFDFGGGVLGRKIGWDPDRSIQSSEFNEKYKDVGPEDFCMLSIRFSDGCTGACTLDTPAMRIGGGTMWQVLSWDPLTLDPSIKQTVPSSNDNSAHEHHGHIRNGIWKEC